MVGESKQKGEQAWARPQLSSVCAPVNLLSRTRLATLSYLHQQFSIFGENPPGFRNKVLNYCIFPISF